jgi:hypothetical protein
VSYQRSLVLLAFVSLSAACSAEKPPPDLLDGIKLVEDDPTDIPLRGAESAELDRFDQGDALFDAVFREADGLGPLYVRTACSSCHEGAARGPGAVEKMALVGEDGVTPLPDQSRLAYGSTARPYTAAGATTPISPPSADAMLKRSKRLGPAVFGRGYIEAIDEAEILRMESEQKDRADGIHGRINRVIYHSKANPVTTYHQHQEGEGDLIGRFGFKARIATLDDFTADAYQGDMGITSALRPDELPNPDGLSDDGLAGVDLPLETINAVADYMRLLEIPNRIAPAGPGGELFTEVGCSVCHAPSLKTRADYPIKRLAGVDAPVFTDLLLHDMGDNLADGLVDEGATSRTWKTAPLIGIRHLKGLLHDGRATTVDFLRGERRDRPVYGPLVRGSKGPDRLRSIALIARSPPRRASRPDGGGKESSSLCFPCVHAHASPCPRSPCSLSPAAARATNKSSTTLSKRRRLLSP